MAKKQKRETVVLGLSPVAAQELLGALEELSTVTFNVSDVMDELEEQLKET